MGGAIRDGITRREFVGTALAAGAGLGFGIGCTTTRPTLDAKLQGEHHRGRPNVVLINIDDMPYHFMSCAGHPYIKTPNLDRLAAEGMYFGRAYCTTPLCGPSRASLMTGLMSDQHGNKTNSLSRHNPRGPFLPPLIQQQGYRTGLVGKLHVGPGSHPRAGFDHWFCMAGVKQKRGATPKQRQATQVKLIHEDMLYNVNGKIERIVDNHTDVCFREAARFVSDQSDKPFFVYVAPFAIHAPYKPAPRHAGMYKGKGLPDRANRDLQAYVKENWLARKDPQEEVQSMIVDYEKQAEMMSAVDEGVGKLLETLTKSGKLGETVIIFTSDNGFMYGEHNRRWKCFPWEESVRAPLIVWAPGLVPQARRSNALVSHTDLLVTVLDLAGGDRPDGCYGVSLAPLLTGRASTVRDSVLTQYTRDQDRPDRCGTWRSVITADHKLTRWRETGKIQLFSLSEDPYELNDLANDPSAAAVRKRMVGMLDQESAEAQRRFQEAETLSAGSGV